MYRYGRFLPIFDVAPGGTGRMLVAESKSPLVSSQDDFACLVDSHPDGLLVVDASGNICHANPAAERMLGCSRRDMLGKPSAVPSQGRDMVEIELISQIGERVVLEARLASGSWRGESVSIAYLRDVTGHKKLLHDMAHSRQYEKHLAYHDALTDLPNRVLFVDRLQQALAKARRNRQRVALLFVDLDGFKPINDSFGHDSGDKLLQVVARRLQSCVRESDTVARLGGDEFSIILDHVRDPENAAAVARKILTAIGRPITVPGHDTSVTASVGISLYPADADEPETLLRCADNAMYSAKSHGKCRYRFFQTSMNALPREEQTMESRLESALENQELVVHYQPQVDLQTGELIGAEALVRWQHPSLGLLLPAEFIPLAEKSTLVTAIDRWVLETACRQNHLWQEMGYAPLRVTVNISARQFLERDFLEVVERVLRTSRIGPNYLGLEITESHAVQNLNQAASTLNLLRLMGVQISVDDFGTGYSSLTWLKDCPIDVLKIDPSFVRHLPGKREDVAITTAIINLGHSLKLKVIAEGVETEEQQSFLRMMRCDGMQGFHFSRPLPAQHLTQFIGRKRWRSSSPGSAIRARARGSVLSGRGGA